jgi:hypothetical protein
VPAAKQATCSPSQPRGHQNLERDKHWWNDRLGRKLIAIVRVSTRTAGLACLANSKIVRSMFVCVPAKVQ